MTDINDLIAEARVASRDTYGQGWGWVRQLADALEATADALRLELDRVDDARAEAERRWPSHISGFYEATHFRFFVAGAAWAASRPVEVTDEMVERAADLIGGALIEQEQAAAAWQWPNATEVARAALEAALGGNDE